MVLVVTGTISYQFGWRVRHCSRRVTVVPPGQTGQGMVEVTVTVVVGHVGQWVVTVGYGHVVGELDGREG